MDCAYYRDCSELSIYLFHRIVRTGELSLLLVDPKAERGPELTDDKLREVWRDIYDEYCKLAEDNKSLMYFMLCDELLYLETRYNVASTLLKQIEIRYDEPEAVDAFITELAQWDFRINRSKPLEEEMDRMYRSLRASTNKIRLKRDELKTYKSNEEPMTLNEQVLKVELALGKNSIDPKTTMVDTWIFMLKEIEKRNEIHQKRLNR